MARVLSIGDLHLPVDHPGYLEFCLELKRKYRTNVTVFKGDIADQQAISFYANNPNCPGPSDEYQLTYQSIQRWKNAFKKAKVCIGNHDNRVLKAASSVNIPPIYLRTFSEVWNTPQWEWKEYFIIDDVYYFHGEGQSGMHPAFNAMKKLSMSCVMGHVHAASGIKWQTGKLHRHFGMDTGCGIEVEAYQFAYGKHCLNRPVLSAGVVIDGIPHHHIMPCSPGEKYWKHNFD